MNFENVQTKKRIKIEILSTEAILLYIKYLYLENKSYCQICQKLIPFILLLKHQQNTGMPNLDGARTTRAVKRACLTLITGILDAKCRMSWKKNLYICNVTPPKQKPRLRGRTSTDVHNVDRSYLKHHAIELENHRIGQLPCSLILVP